MSRQRDIHVSEDPGRVCWRVRLGGRTLSNHRTQSSALTAARRVAGRHQVDLVTDGGNGRIRSKDCYGNERTTRDTEH